MTLWLVLTLLMCEIPARGQFVLIPVLGANFGISHAQAFSDIAISSKGVKTGVLAEYLLSNTFAVQSGALYSGYRIPCFNREYRVNAIEIPLLLQVRNYSTDEENTISFGVGPYLGLQLNGTTPDVFGNGTHTMSIQQYTPLAYIGLNASAGLKCRNKVYLRLSLQPGITNLTKMQGQEYYVSQLSFCIGYYVPFHKKQEDTPTLQ